MLLAFAAGVAILLTPPFSDPPRAPGITRVEAAGSTLRGISYIGFLGVKDTVMSDDLPWLKNHGFNLVRVWATWTGPDESASLVDGGGGLTLPNGAYRPAVARLDQLIAYAKNNGIKVDISFDMQEFTEICKQEGRGKKFANFKAAVTNVTDHVKGLLPNPGDQGDVIFDVCNEAFNARKTGLDSAGPGQFAGTAFNELPQGAYTASDLQKTWAQLLRQLLDIPRGKGFRAFFSAKGTGHSKIGKDKTYVQQFAKYTKLVYTNAYFQEPKALVAPHFHRGPCSSNWSATPEPDTWASRTTERIGWITAVSGGEQTLELLDLYLQEEERRYGDCCKQSCGADQPTSDFPSIKGCGSYHACLHPECDNTSSTDTAVAFRTAFKEAKGSAWAWVFHNQAGNNCGAQNKIENKMDYVEKNVSQNMQFW